MHETKKKLLNKFWEIWEKVWKFSISWLWMVRIGACGTPLGWFTGVQLFMADKWHPKKLICAKKYWAHFEKFGKSCEHFRFLPMGVWIRARGIPFERFNEDQLFKTDRWHPKKAIWSKQKSYCTVFEKFDKRCEKTVIKKTFLVFTYGTIPTSLKEICPAVSEIHVMNIDK